MLKPCVVFDLDGTLADTSGDLLEAANVCFRGLGLGDLLVHGPDSGTALRGGRAMLTLGFDRAGWTDRTEIDRQYPVLLEAYGKAIDHHTVFYPGAIDAVQALRQSNYAVAICTNKPVKLAELLMTNLGARHHFDALLGADSLPVRKPDPTHFWETVTSANGDPNRCLLVGDTLTDHSTARAAGVPSVLVSFGPAGEDMAKLEPDALLHDYADLTDLVETLI